MKEKYTSEISIEVTLDENKVPEEMVWSAEDGGISKKHTKALMLSVWDATQQESLRVDLWTKDMPLDQMQVFFHQSLVSMASTYQRATGDERMSNALRDFCEFFAEERDMKRS